MPAEVKTDLRFQVTFDQKEFSVVTRALAGHELKEHDLPLARDLNIRMLQQRSAQVADYSKQCDRALQVAQQELTNAQPKTTL